jgi:hypothetical protein
LTSAQHRLSLEKPIHNFVGPEIDPPPEPNEGYPVGCAEPKGGYPFLLDDGPRVIEHAVALSLDHLPGFDDVQGLRRVEGWGFHGSCFRPGSHVSRGCFTICIERIYRLGDFTVLRSRDHTCPEAV